MTVSVGPELSTELSTDRDGAVAPTNYVLDSFAVLALFQREPAGRAVREILMEAIADRCAVSMSVINLGEVLYLTERRRGAETAGAAMACVEQLPIQIVDADRAGVLRAARVKANYRVSYADAFAVALARELDATVVTGDPEFRQVEEIVPICWL